jgi:hypothetical protein
MLTSFGARYAGCIDLENVGYEGTPKAVYLDQLARFAEEVMPAFRRATAR